MRNLKEQSSEGIAYSNLEAPSSGGFLSCRFEMSCGCGFPFSWAGEMRKEPQLRWCPADDAWASFWLFSQEAGLGNRPDFPLWQVFYSFQQGGVFPPCGTTSGFHLFYSVSVGDQLYMYSGDPCASFARMFAPFHGGGDIPWDLESR